MQVLAAYNIKGGVGKTTSAVNLAFLAALEGARTLIWDLDPQGATSYYFRVKPKVKGGGKGLLKGKEPLETLIRGTDFEGLDLLPADFSYRTLDLALAKTKKPSKQLARLLKPLSKEYDYVFLDCAPSISLVSKNVFVASDALLVPTIPTPLSLRTLSQLWAYLVKRDRQEPTVLPFFCMVDQRKALHRAICEGDHDIPLSFLTTRIPYSSLVEHMGIHRSPLTNYAPGCEAARAYSALWVEIRRRLSAADDRPIPSQLDKTELQSHSPQEEALKVNAARVGGRGS